MFFQSINSFNKYSEYHLYAKTKPKPIQNKKTILDSRYTDLNKATKAPALLEEIDITQISKYVYKIKV